MSLKRERKFIAIGTWTDDNETAMAYHWGLLAPDGDMAQTLAESLAADRDWLATQFDGDDHPALEGLQGVYVIDPDDLTYDHGR
jgi:hypothetical protein